MHALRSPRACHAASQPSPPLLHQILSLLVFSDDVRLQDTAVGQFLKVRDVFSGLSFSFLLDTFEVVDCSVATSLWGKAGLIMIVPVLLWACVALLIGIWKIFVPNVGLGELTRAFSFSAMVCAHRIEASRRELRVSIAHLGPRCFQVMYTAVMSGLLGMLSSTEVEGTNYIKRDTSLIFNQGSHRGLIGAVTLYSVAYGIILPVGFIWRYSVAIRKAKEKISLYGAGNVQARDMYRDARRYYGFMAKG